MVGIRQCGEIKLNDVIMPQNITVRESEICVFDKINKDEGRLYRFNKEYGDKHLIIEVDEGECFFGRDGNIYLLYSNSDSIVEIYDVEGKRLRVITIEGSVYFIDIDADGNIYAIFPEEDEMLIRMFDTNGKFIRDIHSRDMPILSTLYCDGEHVYAGGFSESISLKLEKVNYMSYIKNSYDFNLKSSGFIVSKIAKYNDIIAAVLSGDTQDTVVLINEADGSMSQLNLPLKIDCSINDIFIEGNQLFILYSDKILSIYDMEDEKENTCTEIRIPKSKGLGRGRGGYLFYLIWVKNFSKDFLKTLIKIAAPLSMVLLLYIDFTLESSGAKLTNIEDVQLFLAMASLSCFTLVMIKNIIIIWKQRARVDNLLDIYNKSECIKTILLKNCIFMGVVLSITMLTLFYSILNTAELCVVLVICCGSVIIVTYVISIRYVKKFKDDMKNMVFQLLSITAKENEMLKKLSQEIKNIKALGIEIYRIKVLTKNKIRKRTTNLIYRWDNSRKRITGDRGKLNNNKDYLTYDLNLKNRDIRYSRLTVIEDFVSYISKNISISSIMIETDDSEIKK